MRRSTTGATLAVIAGALLLTGCSSSSAPAPAASTPSTPSASPAVAQVDLDACDRVLASPAQYRASAAQYWPIVEDPDLKTILQRLTGDNWTDLDWTSLRSLCDSYRK